MVGLKLKKLSGTKKETKKQTKRSRTQKCYKDCSLGSVKNLSKLVKLPVSKSKITGHNLYS